jgi:hypothetical protein
MAARMKSIAMMVMATACMLACASLASAQATRVRVGEVKGKGGSIVRDGVMRALSARSEVAFVSNREVDGASANAYDRRGLSAELQIAAFVEGNVERSGRNVAANIMVIDGKSGETLGVVSYEAKNPKALANRVRSELWNDAGDLIQNAHAAARAPEPIAAREPLREPEPARAKPQRAREPVEEAEKEEGDEQAAEEPQQAADDGARPSPFDVGLAMAGFSRSFEYHDDLSGLSSYDLGLAPTVMLKLHWYPAAHFQDGVLANIGLEVRGQLAFALDSSLDGASLPTSSHALGAGVRARLPLGQHELAALAGIASQTFAIDPGKSKAGPVNPGIPKVAYTYARLGIEARFALGEQFALGAALAYLPTFSLGQVEQWFPHASARGLEAELSLTHALSRAFELNATFGLQRFAFAFHPELDDVAKKRPIAGGALDQYLFGTLGARYVFGL